jgi:hypothetical protein
MAKIVNLNHVRKEKDRVSAALTADQNVAKFGRSKAEKALQTAKTEKSKHDLDGAKRE